MIFPDTLDADILSQNGCTTLKLDDVTPRFLQARVALTEEETRKIDIINTELANYKKSSALCAEQRIVNADPLSELNIITSFLSCS